MFVVATDFDSIPYQIPKLGDLSEDFEDFVTLKEEEILRQILGHELYDAWQAGLDEVYPVQGWTDLSDGADYTIGTTTYKWVGMKKMLIPFVYSEWVNQTTIYHTGIGVTVPKAENATVITSAYKTSKAWNDFAILAGHDYRTDNSLYGFLACEANYDFYKNADGSIGFCSPGTKNIFNL